MIFTSPSSARGNLDEEETPEAQGRRRKSPSKRPSVATQLRMNGQVTARAIAYAAVQVCPSISYPSWLTPSPKLHFSLNDATHWMSDYNGFNYEEFYEFVIDFFEEDRTPEGKAAANELLNWWNRYASGIGPVSSMTDTAADACFYSPPLPEGPHPDLRGGRHSHACDNNARHAPKVLSYCRRSGHRVASIHVFV